MTKQHDPGSSGTKLREAYFHYKKRGFFEYVGRSVLIIILLYSMFMLIVYFVGRTLVDFNSLFETILDNLSDKLVLLVFFISESFLGLVPVDLFVIWTQKFNYPVFFLALLGIFSYAGGIISYKIGRWISERPRIRNYSERKLKNYMDFARKWGGAFIIIAALFPFTPFSLVVIALALLKYPFKQYLLFALSRLLRFVVQGFLMFHILQVQNWIG